MYCPKCGQLSNWETNLETKQSSTSNIANYVINQHIDTPFKGVVVRITPDKFGAGTGPGVLDIKTDESREMPRLHELSLMHNQLADRGIVALIKVQKRCRMIISGDSPRIYLQHNKPTELIELLDLPPGAQNDSDQREQQRDDDQDNHYTAIPTRVARALRQDLRASRNKRLRSPRRAAMMVCLTVPNSGHDENDGINTHSRVVQLRHSLEGICRNARCMDADARAPPQQQMVVCLMLGPSDACLLQYCSESLHVGDENILQVSPGNQQQEYTADITMHIWESTIKMTEDAHFDSTFAPLRFMLAVNTTKEAAVNTLPVLREWFLEGLCEELEPLTCSFVHGVTPRPQALLVAAKKLRKYPAVGGVCGQIARQQTEFSPLSVVAGFHAASIDALQHPLLHLAGFGCLRFDFSIFRFAAVRLQAATQVEVQEGSAMRGNAAEAAAFATTAITAVGAAAPGQLGSCCTHTWEALTSVAAMCWVNRSAAKLVAHSRSGLDSAARFDDGLSEWLLSFAMLRRGYRIHHLQTSLADRRIDSTASATLDQIVTETGDRYRGDFNGTARCLMQGWSLSSSFSSSSASTNKDSGGGNVFRKLAVLTALSLQLSEAFIGALSFAHLQLLMLVVLWWTRAGTGSAFLGPQWCTDGVHGGAAADIPCADTFEYSDVLGPQGPLMDTHGTLRPIKVGDSTAWLPLGAFCGGYFGSANFWTVESRCQTMTAGSIEPLSGHKVYDVKNQTYYKREASKPLNLHEEWLHYVNSIVLGSGAGHVNGGINCNGHYYPPGDITSKGEGVINQWACLSTSGSNTLPDNQIFVGACKVMDCDGGETTLDYVLKHPPLPPQTDTPYGWCRTAHALPDCYDNRTVTTAYGQFGGVKLCDHSQSIFLFIGTGSFAAVTCLIIFFLCHPRHLTSGESPDRLGVVTTCCIIFAIESLVIVIGTVRAMMIAGSPTFDLHDGVVSVAGKNLPWLLAAQSLLVLLCTAWAHKIEPARATTIWIQYLPLQSIASVVGVIQAFSSFGSADQKRVTPLLLYLAANLGVFVVVGLTHTEEEYLGFVVACAVVLSSIRFLALLLTSCTSY
jgi:hypothetical protein